VNRSNTTPLYQSDTLKQTVELYIAALKLAIEAKKVTK
jgi:hypothetical protein